MTQDQLAALILAAVSSLGTSGLTPAPLVASVSMLAPVHEGNPVRARSHPGPHDAPTPQPPEFADPPSTGAARWSWPLAPRPRLERSFAAPSSQWGAGHRGIDLRAAPGQQVTAVEEGVVTHAGVIAGRGTVSITGRSGLRSTYEPVAATVSRGEDVQRGQPIGAVSGASHCGTGCLHIGALRGRAYVDPLPLFRGGPVILLPLRP